MAAETINLQLKDNGGSVLHTFSLPKNKLDATGAPGASDDDAAGYVGGSLWVDRTNNKVYVCADNGTGAAVWNQIAGSGTLSGTYQPLDATLTALAGADWAANALPIGSGSDTVSQVSFAANTFPARASTGNLVAKTITDFGLSLVDDADASAARTTLGLVIGTNVQAYDAALAALAAGSDFVQFSGPTTSTKVFTLPDATCTILTTNAAVTVAQGGTGAATLTNHGVLLGQGTSAVAATAAMTDGQLLVGQTSADPLPKTISGDVTVSAAGAITIGSAKVTLAKIANASANSKLLGSGSAGSGASYAEITIGTGLSMSGTTLSATGTGGTVTSVATGSGLTGGTITTTGTISLNIAGLSSGTPTLDVLVPYDNSGGLQAKLRKHLGLVRGVIDGLTLSWSGGTFTVAAGGCTDSTAAYYLSNASSMTKVLTTAWSAGTGNGALDTGAGANSTWYHIFIIYDPTNNVTDFLASTSATSPTMPTNYTIKRRIGSVLSSAAGGNVTPFSQYGDEFLWDTGVQDVNVSNQSTTAVLRTLTVPTGVQVWAQIASFFGTTVTLMSSPDQGDEAPSGAIWTDQSTAGPGTPCKVRTNTSAQIRTRADRASTTVQLRTIGWIDPRGRSY